MKNHKVSYILFFAFSCMYFPYAVANSSAEEQWTKIESKYAECKKQKKENKITHAAYCKLSYVGGLAESQWPESHVDRVREKIKVLLSQLSSENVNEENKKTKDYFQYAVKQAQYQLASFEKKYSADNFAGPRDLNYIASVIGGDPDYLALSEEKLGVKFDFYNIYLRVREVMPGGKADKSGMVKGMAILRVGSNSYPTQSFKNETESIFVDGVAGQLDLQVMNLAKYENDLGGVDRRALERDWKASGGEAIKIQFDGKNRKDYRQQKIISQIDGSSRPFFYRDDSTLIIPFDEKNVDLSHYELVEKIYSESDVCPLPCNIQVYDSNRELAAEFIAVTTGTERTVDTPLTDADWIVFKRNQPKAYYEVLDAFRGRSGVIGSATIEPSYFIAINERDMFLANYRRFNTLLDWENIFVAFAIGYAETCGSSAVGGRLIETTLETSNGYTSASHTHLVEEELYPLAKQFGVHRNDVLGQGQNGVVANAIRKLGCNSEYVSNYRRNLLAFAAQYKSGKLVFVDRPGSLGFNIKAIERESYKSIFDLQ